MNSKKKERFRTRLAWVESQKSRTLWRGCRSVGLDRKKAFLVRVTDFREDSAKTAVRKTLEIWWMSSHVAGRSNETLRKKIRWAAKELGFTAEWAPSGAIRLLGGGNQQ